MSWVPLSGQRAARSAIAPPAAPSLATSSANCWQACIRNLRRQISAPQAAQNCGASCCFAVARIICWLRVNRLASALLGKSAGRRQRNGYRFSITKPSNPLIETMRATFATVTSALWRFAVLGLSPTTWRGRAPALPNTKRQVSDRLPR